MNKTIEDALKKIKQGQEELNKCRGEVIDEMLLMIAALQVKPQELGFGKQADRTIEIKSVIAPKYKDDKSELTWTGRGRTPQWIIGDKEQYLIK